jgi:predicted HTH transcriptional regulator
MEPVIQPKWPPERLQQLIGDKIEEGPRLEYKAAEALGRSDSKKNGITKDVSAFANSAGGTIIYGLREYDDELRKHLPEKIDPADSREFPREWLDQIIGLVSPRIEAVAINPVRVGPELWQVC